MQEYSDSEIIDCLRDRKGYVVRYLSDRYLPMIRLLVTRMGGTSEDAKDIFQDGLIIIIEKIDSGEFVLTCKFRTFFYCICEKLWNTVLMKRKAASNYFNRRPDMSPEKDFTESYDNQLYERIFYDVFETLDPVSKKILKLYWQEVSPKEIAEKLGYTYGYVRKKKSESQGELINKVYNHPEYKLIKKLAGDSKNVVYDQGIYNYDK